MRTPASCGAQLLCQGEPREEPPGPRPPALTLRGLRAPGRASRRGKRGAAVPRGQPASCRACAEKDRLLIVTIWANATAGTHRAPEYVEADGLLHTALVLAEYSLPQLLLTESPRAGTLPTSSESLDQFKRDLAPSSS